MGIEIYNDIADCLAQEYEAIISVGMSDFRPGIDMSYTDVFERADNFMYEDKCSLKDL